MITNKKVLLYTILLTYNQVSNAHTNNASFRKDYFFLASTQSFYRIYTLERTWQDAKIRCEKEHATLFIPEDQEEVNALLEVWTKTQPQFTSAWVGISSPFSKGDFETIDGRPISDVFSKFDVGEPNNGNGRNEDCVCLHRHGVLHDRHCRLITPFICKKSLYAMEWNTACHLPNSDGGRANAFFRNDYTYLQDTESFYKIHTIQRNWQDARKRCTLEGATLYYPDNQAESEAVLDLWKRTQSAFAWIWVGISDLVSEGDFETVDAYLYDHTMDKCYKFHLTPKNWTDAYSVCIAEQSYLATITSQTEADHLVNLTANAMKDTKSGENYSGAVLLGFHNRDMEGWQTIRGVKVEESGYALWGYQQPDGGDRELCGAMSFYGRLNDVRCSTRAFFICKHDISYKSPYNEAT